MGGLQAACKYVDRARADVHVSVCNALGRLSASPEPLLGMLRASRSVVQRLRARLGSLRMLLTSFTYVINEFYENVT